MLFDLRCFFCSRIGLDVSTPPLTVPISRREPRPSGLLSIHFLPLDRGLSREDVPLSGRAEAHGVRTMPIATVDPGPADKRRLDARLAIWERRKLCAKRKEDETKRKEEWRKEVCSHLPDVLERALQGRLGFTCQPVDSDRDQSKSGRFSVGLANITRQCPCSILLPMLFRPCMYFKQSVSYKKHSMVGYWTLDVMLKSRDGQILLTSRSRQKYKNDLKRF